MRPRGPENFLNQILRVNNCSWCGRSFLWRRIPLPFLMSWVNPSHGICRSCARKMRAEVAELV